MAISRRRFVIGGLGALGALLSVNELSSSPAMASGRSGRGRSLVLVQLTGGNDGLNTVVPYASGIYYDKRPTLAIKQEEALKLSDEFGLHPSMTGMADIYEKGRLSVVLGAGYPSANRSHFRSIEIWQTAEPDKIGETGWLGRYLDLAYKQSGNRPIAAVSVDAMLPRTLMGKNASLPSLSSRSQIEHPGSQEYPASKVKSPAFRVEYPGGKLGDGLRSIARMIVSGVGPTVYTVSLDGFDTHTNQSRTQAGLLKELSDSVTAFESDLEDNGRADDVLMLVFSEFGRRIEENDGRGTDHGTAQPLFLIGKQVKGGIYGEQPSLTSLVDGDLKYTVDFRTVYATILERWLDADSMQVLGRNYEMMAML